MLSYSSVICGFAAAAGLWKTFTFTINTGNAQPMSILTEQLFGRTMSTSSDSVRAENHPKQYNISGYSIL